MEEICKDPTENGTESTKRGLNPSVTRSA